MSSEHQIECRLMLMVFASEINTDDCSCLTYQSVQCRAIMYHDILCSNASCLSVPGHVSPFPIITLPSWTAVVCQAGFFQAGEGGREGEGREGGEGGEG